MTALLPAWPRENAEWLRLRLCRLRAQLNRRALWLQTEEGEPRAADWLVGPDDPSLEERFFDSNSRVRTLDRSIAAFDTRLAELERRMTESGPPPALQWLAERCGLGPLEIELLFLAAAPALDGAFGRAYAELHGDPRRDAATLGLALALFVSDPAERLSAAGVLRPDGRLRALRLLEVREGAAEPLLTRRLSVDERVSGFPPRRESPRSAALAVRDARCRRRSRAPWSAGGPSLCGSSRPTRPGGPR